MPEQLGLDEVARDRRHVDGHERARAAAAVIVQGAGDQLLAGAGLARDHHREIGRHQAGQRPVDLLHGGRAPDQGNILVAGVGAGGRRAARPRQGAPHDGDEGTLPLIGRSPAMQDVYRIIARVVSNDLTVLISGESGTGKELLANAIHRASRRAKAPFIAVNCGAIPEALLESELFGHVKGAYTGAVSAREGLVQAADGGTLFLDEIGDMPLLLQVKLLRVLQERVVRQLGSDVPRPVDVRILSATHRDLDAAMLEGQFREDLYYRLNVITLTLPPLSQRREDITPMATQFLHTLAAKYGKTVRGYAPDALEALTTASWPGNVRQLYNVVEHVCALATAPLIPLSLVQRALRVPSLEVLSYTEAKQRFERNYLVQLLKLTDGNVADAARLAERNRTEFYRLLQKYDLDASLFRTDPTLVATERQDDSLKNQ